MGETQRFLYALGRHLSLKFQRLLYDDFGVLLIAHPEGPTDIPLASTTVASEQSSKMPCNEAKVYMTWKYMDPGGRRGVTCRSALRSTAPGVESVLYRTLRDGGSPCAASLREAEMTCPPKARKGVAEKRGLLL